MKGVNEMSIYGENTDFCIKIPLFTNYFLIGIISNVETFEGVNLDDMFVGMKEVVSSNLVSSFYYLFAMYV